MSVLARILEGRAIRDAEYWNKWASGADVGGMHETVAGVAVTRDTALALGTVWACVSLLGDTVATLPVNSATTDSSGLRKVQPKPAWLLKPNPEQTIVDWLFCIVASMQLAGNAYIYNVLDANGDPVQSWVLDPNYVYTLREFQPDGTVALVYYVQVAKGQQSPVGPFRVVAGPHMFHIPNFMVAANTGRGLPPLEIARMMFAAGIAGQEMAARFFGQGLNSSGVIEVPDEMTDDQARQLKRNFVEANSSLHKMFMPPVITGGASWKQIQVSPEQAQMLQSRQFSVSEIARFYRVPPYMVGELTRSTSWGTGLEQQSASFTQFTLRPILERIEEALSYWMLWAYPNRRIWFNVEGLLRGDRATRTQWYIAGRQWGWLSANDVRLAEGLPPVENGDEYMTPTNMAEMGAPPPQPPAPVLVQAPPGNEPGDNEE